VAPAPARFQPTRCLISALPGPYPGTNTAGIARAGSGSEPATGVAGAL